MRINRTVRYIVLIITLSICSLLVFKFTKNDQMSDNWLAPFLSGARNLEFGGDFMINQEEVKYFQNLSIDQQLEYKFHEDKDLVPYNFNPIGFAYFIKIATTLFFFTGNETALLIFHFLIHFLLCALVIRNIKNTKLELLFFILYACNPFILRYVIFNFYYIYQAVPSFMLLFLLYKKEVSYPKIIFAAIIVATVFVTRPTILFLLPVIGFYLWKKHGWKKFILFAGLFCVVFVMINKPVEKNVWFTAYVGLGAYDTKYINNLSDNEAYQLYENETGKKIDASVGGNYYEDSTVEVFRTILKDKYLSIAKADPLFIVKNAALNFFSSFSFGYLSFLNYTEKIIAAILGLATFLLLGFKKQYKWIVSISLAAAAFTPYYPPIPAYMFGSYILIIFALYETILLTRLKNFLN